MIFIILLLVVLFVYLIVTLGPLMLIIGAATWTLNLIMTHWIITLIIIAFMVIGLVQGRVDDKKKAQKEGK